MPEGKRTQKAPCRKKNGYRKPRAERKTDTESLVQKETVAESPVPKENRVQKALFRKGNERRKPCSGRETNAESPVQKENGYRKPCSGRETNAESPVQKETVAESPVQKENGYRKPRAERKTGTESLVQKETNAESLVQKENGYRKPRAEGKLKIINSYIVGMICRGENSFFSFLREREFLKAVARRSILAASARMSSPGERTESTGQSSPLSPKRRMSGFRASFLTARTLECTGSSFTLAARILSYPTAAHMSIRFSLKRVYLLVLTAVMNS